jgi:two-component system alkaline phosphatase synthesis response regulator PhoP
MNSKILVVEDDPSALRLASYTLEQEGYQVITATDGLEGLRKARDEHPDLIILDIMLPGLDGYEVCQQLRRAPETAKLLILILSAKAREIDKETGLKMGADDYLSKPADPSTIVTKVRTLLASRLDVGAKKEGVMLMVTALAEGKMKEAIQAKTKDLETAFRLIPSPSRPTQLKLILDREKEGDQIVESDGVKILLLSPEVAPMLEGTVIDYQKTPQGGGFTISKIAPK